MNVVHLIGRTTAEIDLRYTQTGKSVGTFTLAVNRLKKEEGADFIRCQVWGKTADNMAKYVHKGNRVAVLGRLKTGSYEKNGVTHYTTDIVAEQVEFLEPPKQNQSENKDYSDPYDGFEEIDEDVPF